VSGRFGGIDVGERRLHCAMLDGGGRILDCATIGAGDPKALASWFDGARVVAIDAPEAPSTAPHGDRAELPPKFRAARCAEIELGRSHGCWVPWVAPTSCSRSTRSPPSACWPAAVVWRGSRPWPAGGSGLTFSRARE
jgi:hypothetical protein